jgi:RHS repeat-associated protein
MFGARRATFVVAVTTFLSLSVAYATDPAERAFTPLGGGSLGNPTTVGARGNLIASLPLLLPDPHGGLPLPFAVAYTGSNLVGAAGVGWDIPIAGVTRQRNLSRRKPLHRFQGQADPAPAERVFVDIGSGPMLMSPTNTAGVYQSFSNGYFELTNVADYHFVGRDASGRTWLFEKFPALYDDDFFPLVRITDARGTNRVDLLYDVYDKFSPAPVSYPYSLDQLSMRELVLREISYSHDASGNCPKYRTELDYTKWQSLNYPVPYPDLLGVDIQAGHARARSRILHSVTLRSNANPLCLVSAPRDIAPHEITERTYQIAYAPDDVTGQPRLAKVDMFGTRDSGADPSTAVPVVVYRYGSPLVPGQPQHAPPAARFPGGVGGGVRPSLPSELHYAATEPLILPAGPPEANDGFSASYGIPAPVVPYEYGLVRDLQDFDGDGRADFVTLNASRTNPLLAINRPSSLGNDFSTLDVPVNLSNTPAAPYNLGAPDLRFNLPVVAAIDNTYQQVIDFNGDGRPDIIIATEGRNPSGQRDPNYWMVLINTPGPSGQPSDIVWLERQIDISALRAEVQQHFTLSLVASTDQNSKPLPVARTHQVGLFDGLTMIESGIVTQWKLVDVNGDGFPDFVFDRFDVDAWNEQCDASGNCKIRQDRPAANSLRVIYHTGPMMAGSGADTQNQWNGPAVTLRADGACGVERLAWIGGGRRQLKCGFMEVTGDGLADYVIDDDAGIRAIRSSGLAQDHDVRLPENQVPADYALQEAKRAIALPGPVGLVKDPLSTVCTPNTPDRTYDIEQVTALRDITGDGIADYIYFGSRGALADGTPLSHPALTPADRDGPPGWWFMAGTGVGFAAPSAIVAPPDVPFALHITRARCDGLHSSIIAGLLDVDGDGRPELLRAAGPMTVQIAKIVDAAGQLGAHGGGQLIAIDNRFGSVTRITYGSAKSDPVTRQNVPFPQIVVTQMEQTTERGLGNPLVPVRYAYGSPEFIYHPLLGRWVFNGYRRRVELVAEPDARPGFVNGTAKVSDLLAATEFTTDADRYALAGRVRDISFMSGRLPADPRVFLPDDLSSATANQHVTWRIQPLPGDVPILVPLEEECYQTPPPQTPGMFGDLVLCRRAMTPYVAEQTGWEGNHAYPASDSVATRTEISAVDDYARATKIKMEGDRARNDEDYCIDISYAKQAAGAPFIAASPYMARTYDCANSSRIFAGVRYLYDGLAEGLVGIGMPSGRILERYDVSTGALLDQIPSATVERDIFGNPVRMTRVRPDGATSTTNLTYDAFGLEPIRTETTATGLAQPLVGEAIRDPNTLLPLTTLDPNGMATHNTFDRFGRLTGVSLTLPGDSTNYALLDTEYHRFDGAPGGREVRHRFYHRWTDQLSTNAVDPATVTTYTEELDELGRRMYGIVDLGSNYNGESLIVDSVAYDGLGRPAFIADPFQGTIFGPRYGTTLTYRADGRAECLIQGIGRQNVATTDETVDRYPTCKSYVYQNGQLLVRTQGPNELAQGKPQFGAYNEETLSATGRVLSRSRFGNGSTLELIEYAYDPLGALSSITRWADPQGGTGAATWSFTNDSLGALLAMREPAGLTRQYSYDAWGRVATVGWTDSTGNVPVQRGVSFRYDGLARLQRTVETLNDEEQPATAKQYFYDVSSGQPQHLDANYLLGKLSYARTASTSVFLGYDPLGRLTTVSRSDADPAAYHAERAAFGPSGEIEALDLLLPDTGHSPERISYEYDSARRLRAVNFRDTAGVTEIWHALGTDVFGRALKAQFGNGAIEHHAYRPDRRRELQSTRIDVGTSSREVVFKGYDGAMLLTGRSELNSLTNPASAAINYQYDARNALARAVVHDSSGPVADTSYSYDGLGNLRSVIDNIAAATLEIRPDAVDPDRICTIGPPGGPSTPCKYQYDATGNVWQIQDTGALFTYDSAGRLRSADLAGRRVQMDYDPFGSIASLSRVGGGIERREHIYGGTSARVDFFDSAGNPINVGDPGATFQNFIERRIVSPVGTLAVARRPNSGQPVTLYPIGDYQGTRAVIDANGSLTESISYSPFGSVVADSGSPNSLTWWPYQWNGGHVLDGFGLVALGQRVLDPRTGRFLQRDPLMPAGTAGSANPYAFARDNPVKFIDQSGAQPGADDADGVAPVTTWQEFEASFQYNLPPPVPGEKVDPMEVPWACDEVHDCMKIVDKLYHGQLTDYETSLRKYHGAGYHLIIDMLSSAVLGYAKHSNIIDIYDREGRKVTTLPGKDFVESDWISPADFLVGPITSMVGRGLRGVAAWSAARATTTAVEARVASEALAGGVAEGMARRAVPWTYDVVGDVGELPAGQLGLTTWEGDIYISWRVPTGTPMFEHVLRHEGVHRFLTPVRGILARPRQFLRKWFYENSTLLRYTEEAWAEASAARSLSEGLRYPFQAWAKGHAYFINPARLRLEARFYGGLLGTSFGVGFGAGALLSGPAD